jgi:hypothetical protein
MGFRSELKKEMRKKYARLYTPYALAKLNARDCRRQDRNGAVSLTSLPTGATLPKETTALIYEHSRDHPARKMTALEVAQYLRQEAVKRGKSWPLA